MKPHEDGLFFKHVQPAEHIRQEVEMYKEMRGLVDGEYVGVHLRYLEGKCPHRARSYYMPKVEKQIVKNEPWAEDGTAKKKLDKSSTRCACRFEDIVIYMLSSSVGLL